MASEHLLPHMSTAQGADLKVAHSGSRPTAVTSAHMWLDPYSLFHPGRRRRTGAGTGGPAWLTFYRQPSYSINQLLDGVFKDKHEAGRPALTSIVTHRYGDKELGSGFDEKLRFLWYQFRESYIFWAENAQDVFKLYGKPGGQ